MKHRKLPNKCPLCGGSTKKGKTTFTADLGFGVVVVRGVPATVCVQCGADGVGDVIVDKLKKLVENARRKHNLVEITTLSA